jgi:sarcosine oxidase
MRIAVIGAGVVGLATTYALRRYQVTVRCYEAASPMAGRSRGGTRIFRYAHSEPALVSYAARAREGWRRWSRTAGEQLVGAETVVVSGLGAPEQHAAMLAAGVGCGIHDEVPGLPTRRKVPGPFLLDPQGGVIQAAATGRFLHAAVGRQLRQDVVERLTVTGNSAVVYSASGRWECDSVLVAAGTGTPGLVSGVGLEVPDELEHHFRFTFPLLTSADATPRCWIERSGAWRPEFTTYGHAVGPGLWAIGGHLPASDVHSSLPVEEARERSQQAVSSYVAEFLGDTLDPTPTEHVYCSPTVGLEDGIQVARKGPVMAVWGENLFKFAPALGADLAAAAASRSLPDDLP